VTHNTILLPLYYKQDSYTAKVHCILDSTALYKCHIIMIIIMIITHGASTALCTEEFMAKPELSTE